MRALVPGQTIHQRYHILALAGRGGMGAVYAARDGHLGATVALKQTLASDEVLRRAFRREARLLAALHHPALPRVLDHFEDAGELFLAMEYVPGDDLGARLAQRRVPFSIEDVLAWADTLLDALEYLHRHTPPVIHRDIKPQNLKLTHVGKIVLLDFGLARGTAGGQTLQLSGATLTGYTPHYAPLEQIQGGATDARADLYGLGATLYHLLAGAAPADALARGVARLNGDPDPLRHLCDLRPAVPRALGEAVMRTLALRAADRPASAAELRASLRAIAAGSADEDIESAADGPTGASTRRPSERRWLWGVPVLAVGLAVSIGVAGLARPTAATASSSPSANAERAPVVVPSSPSPLPPTMTATVTAMPSSTTDASATARAALPTATATEPPSPTEPPSATRVTRPQPTARPHAQPTVRPRPTAVPTAAPAPVPIIPGP